MTQIVRFPEPVDSRAGTSANAITNELHWIGEDNDANWVTTDEAVKDGDAANVTISGFSRVTGTPAAGQFRVYDTASQRLYGKIEFNAANNGQDVSISYNGVGTPSAAALLKRLREMWRQSGKNFLQYQRHAIADYDAMWTLALADAVAGDTFWFPGNRTYSWDKVDLGTNGKANLRFVCGAGAIWKKKTGGTFGATNTEHLFYDKASTSDGLEVIGAEIDLSRASASNGNTVSAFMLVRHDRFRMRYCKVRDGIEEGLKLYKCQDVRIEGCEFNNIRNNGVQCHAPSSDGYTGAKSNRGWERIWIGNGCWFIDIDDGAGGAIDGEGATFNSTDKTVVCTGAWVLASNFLRCIRGIHSEGNPSGSPAGACWMDDIHFVHNNIRDSKCHGLIMGGCRYSHAHGNTIRNTGQTGNLTGEAFGLKLTGTQGAVNQPNRHCQVTGNTIFDDRGGSAQMTVGLYVTVAEEFHVDGNDSRGATKADHFLIDTYCTNGYFMPGNIKVSAKCRLTGGYSLANGGGYSHLTWGGTELWNRVGTALHSTSSSNDTDGVPLYRKFKVPTFSADGATGGLPGIYHARCNMIVPSGGDTTKRGLRLEKTNAGGATLEAQASGAAVNGDDTAYFLGVEVELTTGDWMQAEAMQASAGGIGLSSTTWFQMDYTGRVKPMAMPLA